MLLLRLRKRLPLVAFVLLAVICLLLVGFACACLTDQPLKSLDRATSVLSALPALIEAWPLIVLSLLAAVSLLQAPGSSPRRSPALLQRFLL